MKYLETIASGKDVRNSVTSLQEKEKNDEEGEKGGGIRTRGSGCCKSHSTSLPETIAVKFFKLQFYYHTHTHAHAEIYTHTHTH